CTQAPGTPPQPRPLLGGRTEAHDVRARLLGGSGLARVLLAERPVRPDGPEDDRAPAEDPARGLLVAAREVRLRAEPSKRSPDEAVEHGSKRQIQPDDR